MYPFLFIILIVSWINLKCSHQNKKKSSLVNMTWYLKQTCQERGNGEGQKGGLWMWWKKTWLRLKWRRRILLIETTGEGKSAVTIPDEKSRKKKTNLKHLHNFSCGITFVWSILVLLVVDGSQIDSCNIRWISVKTITWDDNIGLYMHWFICM